LANEILHLPPEVVKKFSRKIFDVWRNTDALQVAAEQGCRQIAPPRQAGSQPTALIIHISTPKVDFDSIDRFLSASRFVAPSMRSALQIGKGSNIYGQIL